MDVRVALCGEATHGDTLHLPDGTHREERKTYTYSQRDAHARTTKKKKDTKPTI
jgi:hypothetical protein